MRVAHKKLIVVGLFSARFDNPTGELTALTTRLEAAGAQIVGRVMQRRGVSRAKRPGGSKQLDLPMGPALISDGKARELATLCRETGVDLVVTLNVLTEGQRKKLAKITGVDVVSALARLT